MMKPIISLLCMVNLYATAQEALIDDPLVDEVKAIVQLQETEKEDTFAEQVKTELKGKGKVLGMVELPIKRMMFVEAESGSYLVSSNGRFVFQGKLQDVWHRKSIRSIDDANATKRTPLTNLNFKPEEQLATWVVGNQNIPRQGLVFVDPTSELTQTFLQTIFDNPDKYNFTVALMPLIGGDEAVARTRALYCAKDKEMALQDLLHYTNDSTSELQEDCKQDKLVFTVMMAEVLDISNLPHVIREDGLVSDGLPVDLDSWLAKP